jgi:hypothetical protein
VCAEVEVTLRAALRAAPRRSVAVVVRRRGRLSSSVVRRRLSLSSSVAVV